MRCSVPINLRMRPLIGVTTSELRPSGMDTLRRPDGTSHPEMVLGMTYMRAVDAAGGVPVVLPPVTLDVVPALLARLDGIVLSGGPDIDPEAYGAIERHEQLGPTHPALDAFELAIAHAADAAAMPVLAICRGAQAMNVARGGTLHQHVDGHRQRETSNVATQVLQVEAGSRLAEIACAGGLEVNSFHHQAVERLGAGLRVSARAADGTIEAIEDPSRDMFLGVQWHAETISAHGGLFAALVAAAARDTARPLRVAA